MLVLVDHVAAGLGVLPVDEAVANRPDAAADPVARLDDGDGRAHRGEVARGHQSREAGAGHQDRGTVQARILRHILNSIGKAAPGG